jgi:hypothetical protein
MLLGALAMALQNPWVAALWVLCFSLANGVGTWMWRRRDRLAPYPAAQLLVLVVGVCGMVALASIDVLRPQVPVALNMPRSNLRTGELFLLTFVPGFMAWCALQERAARKLERPSSSV